MRRERAQVVRAFPGGIFDTKHLARSLPGVFEEGTSLAEVYSRMQGRGEDDSGGVLLKLPQGMGGEERTGSCTAKHDGGDDDGRWRAHPRGSASAASRGRLHTLPAPRRCQLHGSRSRVGGVGELG